MFCLNAILTLPVTFQYFLPIKKQCVWGGVWGTYFTRKNSHGKRTFRKVDHFECEDIRLGHGWWRDDGDRTCGCPPSKRFNEVRGQGPQRREHDHAWPTFFSFNFFSFLSNTLRKVCGISEGVAKIKIKNLGKCEEGLSPPPGGGMMMRWLLVHKPCLAREADTWSASVESCGESVMLRLPEDDTVLSWRGESSRETISAPWSVRALAVSRNVSLWDSICVKIYENITNVTFYYIYTTTTNCVYYIDISVL